MTLQDVYSQQEPLDVLWRLMKEREPHQNISHKTMPTKEQHRAFFDGKPYMDWRYIMIGGELPGALIPVGAIYLTHQREIGIGILKQHRGHGYAKEAIRMLRELHPGPCLANINPHNKASRRMFEKLGFNLLQVTYAG